MADTTTAAPEAAPLRMPYEGREVSVEEAAATLLGSDSHEEHPDDEQDEAPEADPADEAAESENEAAGDDAEDAESDPTPEDGSTEADDPLAEKKRQIDADYTRKTQALAEERKTFEAEREQVRAERSQYAAVLQHAESLLKPAEVDWTALRAELPADEFAARWAEHQIAEKQYDALRVEREKVEAQERAEAEAAHKAHLAEESAKLLAAIPEWAEEEAATKGKAAVMDYAKQAFGVSEEELSTIADHRWIVLLEKARKYDEMTTKGAAALAEKKAAAPVLKPGARDGSAKPSGVDVAAKIARDRFNKSGSVDDAAALILARTARNRG